MLLGTGRKLRPVQGIDFLATKSEHKVRWEAVQVTFDLLVEALGGRAARSASIAVLALAMPEKCLCMRPVLSVLIVVSF